MTKLKLLLHDLWIWFLFGKVTSRQIDFINGVPCEIAFYNSNGTMIGYWAYGSFDPSLPYQG